MFLPSLNLSKLTPLSSSGVHSPVPYVSNTANASTSPCSFWISWSFLINSEIFILLIYYEFNLCRLIVRPFYFGEHCTWQLTSPCTQNTRPSILQLGRLLCEKPQCSVFIPCQPHFFHKLLFMIIRYNTSKKYAKASSG